MPFVQIDDIKLYYETHGPKTAPVIILLHAGIVHSQMWEDQVNFLSPDYKIITYDLRGFGKSSFSEKKFFHAEDLKKLLDHLNIRKARIVGCSFSCQIAFDFVLEYPEYVLSLILVNSRPFGFKSEKEDSLPLVKEIEQSYIEKNISKIAEIETLFWFVGRKRTKEEVDSTLFKKVVDMNYIALQNEFKNPLQDKFFHPDAMNILKEIPVPISFIVGSLNGTKYGKSM